MNNQRDNQGYDESRFRNMVESLKEEYFFYSRDTNGVFTYLSPSITNVLGYWPYEFSTHYTRFLTQSPINDAAIRRLELNAKGEKQPAFEVEIYHKDTGVRTLEVEETATLDSSQAVISIEGVAHDISVHKKKERCYQLLFNDAPDAIVTLCTSDYQIQDFNTKALEIFRCSADELLGKTPYELSPDTQTDGCMSKEKTCDIINGLVNTKSTTTFEWRHKRFDDEIFDAEVSLAILEHEPELILQAIIRDITERKELDKKLRLMKHWVEHSVDLFFWVREDAQVLYVNQAVCDLLGYGCDEMRTMKVGDFDLKLPPDKWPDFAKKLRELGSYCLNTQLQSKDGSITPVEITANILPFEGSDYFFAYGRDISAKVNAEKERKLLEKQLFQSHKLEAIGTLAGGIAHDFNNILSAIVGYAELSKMDLPNESIITNNIDNILKASKRAKNLVRQILTFSRNAKLKLKPIDIRSIVEESIDLLRATLPSSITIKQNLTCDPFVVGDKAQIQQILMNLCTNAGHAMDKNGGTLEVHLQDVQLNADFLTRFEDVRPGSYAELNVSDTGKGMSPETLERIYDPFFTTKPRGKGTGMGLAVVHGIVRGLNGVIVAKSKPGEGSRFTVYLPTTQRPSEPAAEALDSLPLGKERILYIDDEPDIVAIGKQLLEGLGYQVVGSTNSIEALELFRSQPDQFDLVITDLTMPQMTGDFLAKELIALRKDIPIILCSGLSFKLTETDAKEMGVDAVLMKPIDRADLAQSVRRILEKRKKKQR